MPSPAHPRLRIYLDACCLSRLTDNQGQPRVRREAEAVEHILALAQQGSLIWISSTVLDVEVGRNPNHDHRRDTEALLAFAGEVVIPGEPEADRARQIAQLGFEPFDALHLASAERAKADVFLTTDEALLRRAQRSPGLLRVRVENPVSWYLEVQT